VREKHYWLPENKRLKAQANKLIDIWKAVAEDHKRFLIIAVHVVLERSWI
jgi:hypothetical protein